MLVACLSRSTAQAQETPSDRVETGDDASSSDSSGQPGAASRFLRDVAADYKHFFSKETAVWLGVGGGLALAIHPADEAIRDETQGPTTLTASLEGGRHYGATYVQIPLAVGWWTIGHAAGSERGAAAGRDLLRAQINVATWTFALKAAVDRTRPNGEPYSFPSGHSSATFAAAMVLEDHYGWKVGVPALGAATYTAISRLTDNKHWASDVVFGAFLGMASARTVTLHLRTARVTIAPLTSPGGGRGIRLSVARAAS
jgi:membrane-associated phospholipid phosphatase